MHVKVWKGVWKEMVGWLVSTVIDGVRGHMHEGATGAVGQAQEVWRHCCCMGIARFEGVSWGREAAHGMLHFNIQVPREFECTSRY